MDNWRLSRPIDQDHTQQESPTNDITSSLDVLDRQSDKRPQPTSSTSPHSAPTTTTKTTMLMIEGPKFSSFDFSPEPSSLQGEPFEINGHRIVLPPKTEAKTKDKDDDDDDEEQADSQDTEAPLSHTASTAKSVWDCSIVLGKYLEALSHKTHGFWEGKRVLELGAGQGIVSLSAAALGAERVIMTDIDSAVPSLERGARLNGFEAPQVQVIALDWTNRSHALQHIWNDLLPATPTTTGPTNPQLDYILASDVIWVDYLVPALVDTIADLIRVSNKERRDSGTHHHPPLPTATQDPEPTQSQSPPSLPPPVLLLAYQFRSTRSDQLLFDSLDQLGLLRKKIILDGQNNDDPDSVYMDPKFRKPNLAIWKVWKE